MLSNEVASFNIDIRNSPSILIYSGCNFDFKVMMKLLVYDEVAFKTFKPHRSHYTCEQLLSHPIPHP